MVIVKVFKHVVSSGEASAASFLAAFEDLTILGATVCHAVTFHIGVEVKGSRTIVEIAPKSTMMLAVNVIAVDVLVAVSFKHWCNSLQITLTNKG
jgi:hypothetical protein